VAAPLTVIGITTELRRTILAQSCRMVCEQFGP
jgi:hypothetical protein